MMTDERFDGTPSAATDFHVSPQGDDSRPGTSEQPFRTLARARDAVRKVIARGLERDVTVLLRGGMYELSEPLVFGSEDSGSEERSITYAAYPGERPVISGGRRVTAWQADRDGIWAAGLPRDEEFRALWVNGRRAIRARMPHLDDEPPYWRLASGDLAEDLATFTLTLAPETVRPWQDVEDIEVIVLGAWEITRKRLARVDAAAGLVTLAPPHVFGHSAMQPARGMACHFENGENMRERPGEWHLNRRTGLLRYRPLAGEDMRDAEVIAPALTQLLRISGTPERPVRNLRFKGLTFSHTHWPLPAHGYNGRQACSYFPAQPAGRVDDETIDNPLIEAAVEWECAHGCRLEECEISHSGGSGLRLRKGCHANVVERSHVFDIGANGVMVGEDWCRLHLAGGWPPAHDVPTGNTVANNEIHDCGADYYGAVGVWVAFTDGTVVSHNLAYALPYTGISVGFIWNDEPTVCRNNIIECNHIYDVMRMLADGGGIYTLGFQPGTVLRGNLIHDVCRDPSTCASSPNNGIFFDEGSSGYLIEDNVIYNTPEGAIRFNASSQESHAWRNNTLDVAPGSPGFPAAGASTAGPGR